MAIDKIINPNFAANAYMKNANVGQVSQGDETDKAGESGGFGGVKFADILKDRVQDVVDTVKTGEEASAKAVTGEANITEVIQAVTEAELTLEAVVAVRDRMISAYQSIMQMPI